jgi:hypothetical protein
MSRTALLLLVACSACGRLNNGVYDKLTMNIPSATLARTPTRFAVSRYDPSLPTARFRPVSLSCTPACEVEVQATDTTAAAVFLVTFGQPGSYRFEPVVARVPDGVLFADEFVLEVVDPGPPRLELKVAWGGLQPVSPVALVKDGWIVACASTTVANSSTPVALGTEAVRFEPTSGVVSVQAEPQHSSLHACQRLVAREHGVARVDVSLGGATQSLTVDVVDPKRITSLSVVSLSGVTAKDIPLGPAREPLDTMSGSRSSVFRVEATTDDQRTVPIEPRCLKVRNGQLLAAAAVAYASQPVRLDAFTISTTSLSFLEWNPSCGPLAVPFSIRVLP